MANITSLKIGQNDLNIGGKWHVLSSNNEICDLSNFSGTTNLNFSPVIPDDGYCYEVIIHFEGISSGNNSSTKIIYDDVTTVIDITDSTWRVNNFPFILSGNRSFSIFQENKSSSISIRINACRKLYKDPNYEINNE